MYLTEPTRAGTGDLLRPEGPDGYALEPDSTVGRSPDAVKADFPLC